jgi:hypothetical protein
MTEILINSTIPLLGALFEAVKGAFYLANKVFRIGDKATKRLEHINIIIKVAFDKRSTMLR